MFLYCDLIGKSWFLHGQLFATLEYVCVVVPGILHSVLDRWDLNPWPFVWFLPWSNYRGVTGDQILGGQLVKRRAAAGRRRLLFCQKLGGQSPTLPTRQLGAWILKGSLDSIPSPSPSEKIQIMGGKVCLSRKGKTLLGVVNRLLKTKSLLTWPSNVLPYYLK